MKRKDYILIFIVLLIVGITLGMNYIKNTKDKESIEIYVDNKLYKTYDINDRDEIKIETSEGYNIIKVHDKGVEIVEASCPDKVCIHSGFITNPSESIVCLPHKVHIKIKTNDLDKTNEDVISN